MGIQARYAHTNLIANDWRALADFYIRLFDCVPVPPERDLAGESMERGTGVPAAHIRGIHIRLPGYGENGPTLEIFSYQCFAEAGVKAINRPGFGHIAFQVNDVAQARDLVLANGGKPVGEIISTPITPARSVTWCYLTDPEGNILELQA